jgi:MscS family membrane protein
MAACLLTTCLFLAAFPATAQEEPVPAGRQTAIPEDTLGRGTPRGTIEGFQRAAEAGDYATAAQYLDLRNLPDEIRQYTDEQIALGLKIVLERSLWIDLEALSTDAEGIKGDSLPSYRDELGIIEGDGQEVRLFLQRVPRGDGEFIWKVSNATLARLPELYEVYRYPAWIESIFQAVPRVSFLGAELFKWVIGLGFIVASYPLLYLLGTLLARSVSRRRPDDYPRIRKFFVGPLAVWIIVFGVRWIHGELGRGAMAQEWAQKVPFILFVTAWLLWAVVSLFRDLVSARLEVDGRPGAALLLRPFTNALKLVIATGAILVWLDNLGFSITTLLAGLGVGGIAVALALQKPMEDVFGAVNIYAQGLVRIGDFCQIGNMRGMVEEIGLRSTRFRTLANTVVAIPNSRLASEPIDNISARQKIWYHPLVRLRLDTTPEQVRQILGQVSALLESDEQIMEESARVRFTRFGEQGLELQISAYIGTVDWVEYLEIAEDLNLKILDIVIAAGAALALPIVPAGASGAQPRPGVS